MMADPDPRPTHDPDPAATRLDPASDPSVSDSVVRLPGRAGAEPPERASPAGSEGSEVDDETVVDLRAGVPGTLAAIPPPTGTDASVDDAAGATAASEPVAATATHRSAVAGRIVRSLLPVAAVLLVALVLTVGALWQAEASRSAAQRAAESADDRALIGARLDEVWTDVLANVAGGVGQQVSSEAELLESLGSARNSLSTSAEPVDVAPEVVERAAVTQERALAVMTESIESAGGDPVELGNELQTIDEAVSASKDATTEVIDLLRDESSDRLRSSGGWSVTAGVVMLVGLLLAGVALAGARRRWKTGVDVPIASLLDRLDAAELCGPTDESDRSDTTPGAYPELQQVDRRSREAFAVAHRDLARLRRRAEWDDWARRVFEALELVDDEEAAHAVVERALVQLDSGHPVELLLAERGSNRLHAVASDITRAAPGCPVESISSCVALRRGQVSTFGNSDSINSCPHLRDRPGGPCSAVCVPVTVAARPVGVLHTTGPVSEPASSDETEQLVTISTQLGARLSSLRTLESSRHDAATDGLTGLPNRRTLEAEVGELLDRGTPFIMVLADLDKFKVLNDNFGHEVGDKALQLFAGVLRDNIRGNDLVARLGGEEFVLVYPTMTVETSIEAIGRLRAALARAINASTVPPFTCSFGIAHSTVAADGDAILRIADAGLLQAKDLGGDQAVVADPDLAASVFSEDAPPRSSRIEPDRD